MVCRRDRVEPRLDRALRDDQPARLRRAGGATDRGQLLRIWEWDDATSDARVLRRSTAGPGPTGPPGLRACAQCGSRPEAALLVDHVAVAESEATRALASADLAWRTTYDGSIETVPMPHPDHPDVDADYPMTATAAADYFFRSPTVVVRGWLPSSRTGAGWSRPRRRPCADGSSSSGERHRWPAVAGVASAVPADGTWRSRLGLATTQLEHLRLAGRGDVRLGGGVRSVGADPAVSHSRPVPAALGAVAARLDSSLRW